MTVSVAAVENAGIKKLKIYHTVNTKMEFKHPNYYKNLRKLYRSRNRDQAISDSAATADRERAPGTGQQADKPRVTPTGISLIGCKDPKPASRGAGGPEGLKLTS